MYRRCKACNLEKDESDYYPHATRGLQSRCKTCDKEASRLQYEAKVAKTGHYCRVCGEYKHSSEFGRNGKGNLERLCKICKRKSRPIREALVSSKLAQIKLQRLDPNMIPKFVLTDCRRSDRKKNRDNDLTLEVVRELLANPCSYCEETSLRMTLDRKDNSIGHVVHNVVPSCIRCNLARGSMPYEAWLCLVPGVKQALREGLFGHWQGK